MDKYSEIVKEVQRGNQEAKNMLENQLKKDYQYMVANVSDLAQAEGLLRSAIASAMANITPGSNPDGIGESVRRNLEWNITTASQVRRNYNQSNNYNDDTVTFSRSGSYSMNNPQGGYSGNQGNGYSGNQGNIYPGSQGNGGYPGGQGNGYQGSQGNRYSGSVAYQNNGYNQNNTNYSNQQNNNYRNQNSSYNPAPASSKKGGGKYIVIGICVIAALIGAVILYNVFKDNGSASSGGSHKKVSSGTDDTTSNSTEDYTYQEDTETTENNIAEDTGYEDVINDYFYYYSNEDEEGMKLCYLDCIRGSMEEDMYSSVSGANSMADYWQVMENGYGSDFVISAEIKSVDECDASTIAVLEAHVQTTYGGTVTIDRAVIANLHETCRGSLKSYSFDESIYVAYIDGEWYMIGTVLE